MIAQNSLRIKKSTLPDAGKGLFTRAFIPKGSLVTEYKGALTTWKKIQDNEVFNGYVFYINRNRVIDAKHDLKAFGRYANDARGIRKIKGIANNAEYSIKNKKVYIRAITDIDAGAEIFVAYGKEYWDSIKYNLRLAEQQKKNDPKKRA